MGEQAAAAAVVLGQGGPKLEFEIMTGPKTAFIKKALIAAMAASALTATATAASADVACNRYGECWHVKDHYTNYPAAVGVTFHDEAWYASHRHDRRTHWRQDRDDDHGYYAHGTWHPF